MLDLLFLGKDFKTPEKPKGPKHSNKYCNIEPFIDGEQYKLGKYIGVFRGCFIFKTDQKDSSGQYLANFVSRFDEELIESLLAKN